MIVAGAGGIGQTFVMGGIVFDSRFAYNINNAAFGTSLLRLDVSSGSAFITVTNTFGNSAHTINSAIDLLNPVVVTNNGNGNLNLRGVISGDGSFTKEGRGRVSLGSGTNASVNTFIGDLFINRGIVSINGGSNDAERDGRLGNVNNDLFFTNGAVLNAGTGFNFNAGRVLTFNAGGGTLDIGGGIQTVDEASQLTGSGALYKTGVGTLNVTVANNTFTGPVNVVGGLLSTTDVNALGVSGPGAGLLTVGTAAQATLADAAVNGRSIMIGRGGVLQSGTATFGSLDRGVNNVGRNLIAVEGAVIAQTAAGVSASVQNLGTRGDLFLGIGATDIPAVTVAVGAGTPWAGLSTTRSSGLIRSGTVTMNGPMTLQSLNGSILTLGEFVLDAANKVDLIAGASPGVVTVSALGATGGGAVRLAGNSPILTGVTSWLVRPGATLDPKGIDSLGGKPLEVQIGGQLGSGAQGTAEGGGSASLNNTQANAYGASTITLRGANQILFRTPSGSNVNIGGNWVVDAALPVLFNANQGAPTGGTQTITTGPLTFASNNSGIQQTAGSNRNLIFTGVVGGTNAFTIAPLTSGTIALTLTGFMTGSGTFTKGDAGELRLDNDLSGFTGNVVLRAGITRLPAAAAVGDPARPAIFAHTAGNFTRIADSNSLAAQDRGYALLQLNQDADISSSIDPASTGILGLLNVNNSTLTGFGGSSAFLAATGGARTYSGAVLAPGAGATYRLGGGGQTLTMDAAGTAGALTGANNLIVGGFRNDLTGAGVWTNGTGNVILADVNTYTGTTRVNPGSVLTLNIDDALGGDGATSGGPITVFGTMNIGNTASSGVGTLNSAFNSSFTVDRGGTLALINTGLAAAAATPNRIPDAVTVSLRNGTFTIGGSASVAVSETVGGVSFAEGSQLTVTRGSATQATTLTAANGLTRATGNRGTLQITPTNNVLGTFENVIDATRISQTLVNPYIVSSVGSGNFLATDGTGKLVNARYTGSDINTTTAADIFSTGAAQTLTAASTAVRALRVNHSISQGAGASILDIGGASDTEGGVIGTVNATIGANGTNATTLEFGAREAVFFVNNATTLTVGSTTSISGGAGLTKFGAGNLTLTGTNSYTGVTTVNAGTLQLSNSKLSGDVSLNPGATLALRSDVANGSLIDGRVTVTSSPTGSSTIDVNRLGATTTDQRLGVQNLTLADDSRLNVADGSSYRFTVFGDLALGERAVINAAPFVFAGTSYSDTATTVYSSNSADGSGQNGLQFENGSPVTVNATIRGTRAFLRASGPGTVVNYNGYLLAENTTAGPVAVDGGRIVFGAAATLDNSLGWNGTTYQTQAQIAIFGNATGEVEFAEGFQAAKVTGTLDRTDVNWGGETSITGSTLVFNHSQNYPSYQGFFQFESNDAGWRTQTNAQTFGNLVALRGTNVNMENLTSLTLTGPVFIGTGVSVASMTALQRDWSEDNGLLNLTQDVGAPTPGQITKSGAAALNLDGPIIVSNESTIRVLEGTANLNGNVITSGGANTLNLDTQGAGTAVFNASITLAAGDTLTVRNQADAGPSTVPTVTINLGKTLSGNGTLVNPVTIASGGNVSPGASAGILNTSDFTLASGGNYLAEANGSSAGNFYDQINVTGAVTLAGNLFLTLDFVPNFSDNLFIINNDGSDSVIGVFANAPTTFTTVSMADNQAYTFLVSYTGDFATNSSLAGAGNDVVLYNATLIPEPSVAAMLSLGLIALLGVRRRRRAA